MPPSSNHDLTVVSTGSVDQHDSPCCKVAMCEGSSPHMSKETRSLLRSRLRTASLMLATGFGLFFLRNLFIANYSSPSELGLLIFHGLTTLTLLLVGGRLCQKCTFQLSTLRIAELAIFGVPALFFIAMQWLEMQAGLPFYIGITAPWMLLILTYSLYIPNSWQHRLDSRPVRRRARCHLHCGTLLRPSICPIQPRPQCFHRLHDDDRRRVHRYLGRLHH